MVDQPQSWIERNLPPSFHGAVGHFGAGKGGKLYVNRRTANAFAIRRRLDPHRENYVPLYCGGLPEWPALRQELAELQVTGDGDRGGPGQAAAGRQGRAGGPVASIAGFTGCVADDFLLGLNMVDLRCGDCLKILPTLSGIDAVVSDPPYGMKWNTDSSRFTGGRLKLAGVAATGNESRATTSPSIHRPGCSSRRRSSLGRTTTRIASLGEQP